MSGDALVVGGTIHDRLAQRERLRAHGFRVTLERSAHRGLTRLEKHPFAYCSVDLTDVPRASARRRRYDWASSKSGTELRAFMTDRQRQLAVLCHDVVVRPSRG